jgi:hypothetical protein
MKGVPAMDIYSILSSKPHNPHYLNRYITFIEQCQQKNIGYEGYTEKHHIYPKAKDMFPEYKDFRLHPWNCAVLTARQHFIAHLLLWKTFPNTVSCVDAIWNMSCRGDIFVNSRLYESMRIEAINSISNRMKNRVTVKDPNNILCYISIYKDSKEYTSGKYIYFTKDRVVVNKEGIAKMIESSDLDKYLSMGYNLGFNFSEVSKDKMKKNKDKNAITDGISVQFIDLDMEEIPEGWSLGSKPDSKETREKKRNSRLGKSSGAKNRVSVIDPDTGKTLSVSKDDPLFLSGHFVGVNKGKKGIADHLNAKNCKCEYCGFITTKGNYSRWHGDNCRNKS